MTLPVSGPAVDTSGVFILDTGAGYLALDEAFAKAIGYRAGASGDATIRFLGEPLPKLGLGTLTREQIEPVLALDLTDVRAATDRPVVGLLGVDLFRDDAIVIDDDQGELLLVRGGERIASADPIVRSQARLADVLGSDAQPMRYERIGDGKIALRATIPGARDTLLLILDTGATKTVLFERWLAKVGNPEREWHALKGLRAPTLYGDVPLRLVRVPRLSLLGGTRPLTVDRMDAGVIQGGLAEALNRALDRDIAGLLGFSFTRRFRLAIDFRERVLWWSPRSVGTDHREFEHSSVGLQLKRDTKGIRVVSVASGSPAARAGIRAGDLIRALDGTSVDALSMDRVGMRLEGRPGTTVHLTLTRGHRTYERTVTRVRLL